MKQIQQVDLNLGGTRIRNGFLVRVESSYGNSVEWNACTAADPYRLGQLLQSLLLSWGIFGQQALVLAANWLHLDTRSLTIPARGVTAALAVALILAACLRPKLTSFGWPTVAFLGFWLVYGSRLVFEAGADLKLDIEPGRLTFGFVAAMAGGSCFLPGMALMSNASWNWHGRALAASVALAGLSGIVMFSLYGERITRFENRISSDAVIGDVGAVHPLALGYTGTVLVVFALYFLICSRCRLSWRLSLGAVLGVLGVVLLVGSASRGPMVALGVAFFALIMSLAQRLQLQRLFVFAAVSVAVFCGLLWYANVTGSIVFNRLFGIADAIEREADSAGRLDLYAYALSEFARSPLVGTRLTLDHGTVYPHNLIVEALMATGLLGTVPLLILLTLGLVTSWSILTRYPELGWIPLLFLVFFTGGMFSWSIVTNVEMWLALGATFSMASWARRRDRADMARDPDELP